jgi:cellulose biosynthesis protein BcsQ
LAVNLAASIARRATPAVRVCLVDADPSSRDVTTRLAVARSSLDEVVVRSRVSGSFLDGLASVYDPPLWVLPCVRAGVALSHRGLADVVAELRAGFDVVVCDLACGADGSGVVHGDRLGFDWVLLAVTPERGAVEAAVGFVDQFGDARLRGDVAVSVRLGVVTTGDEGSTELSHDVVGAMLGQPVLASVPQLWGRAAPNVGFGAALGIDELDVAVWTLFERLQATAKLTFSRAS